MYKPKIAIKTSFSFNLPYFESKQERIYHVKKKQNTAHLLNQAAIRHTSSNNWYNIFIIHLFTLSQTFWKQFCWSTSLISDCWFLVVFPTTFTVRSFAAGTRDIFSPERMGCSLCPTLIHILRVLPQRLKPQLHRLPLHHSLTTAWRSFQSTSSSTKLKFDPSFF